MASRSATAQYICDQAGLGPRLGYRKMFGEYALYLDGKVVALICDDQLFLKPTPAGRAYLGSVSEAPPYPGAKNFYLLSAELEDPDRLREALRVTAGALPEPAPKPRRKIQLSIERKSEAKLSRPRSSSKAKAKRRKAHE